MGPERGVVVELLRVGSPAARLGVCAVAEGQRRHRQGARSTIDRIQQLRGLRDDVSSERAQALFALSTNHEAWRELISGYQLDWDSAEDWLVDALSRPLLARRRHKQAGAS